MKKLFLLFALILFSNIVYAQEGEIRWQPNIFNIFLLEGEESSHDLVVSNSGDAQLIFGVQTFSEEEPNFINELQNIAFYLNPGESQTVSFVVSAQALSVGQYHGHLLVASNDLSQPYVEVPIVLEVNFDYVIESTFPDRFALLDNFPNPFNPTTNIVFELPQCARVQLEVYDVRGELVGVLLNGAVPAGRHQVSWQAQGRSSGVYFIYFRADNFLQVNKVLLTK